jgi:NAD(P)-dependent dehydrogenase (short-subunit alcohol dehydrogenase family)
MGQLELAAQPMMSGMLEQTPAGRLGRPDEIAAVIDFLLSDDASYVTGTDVLVDGGIMAAITS